MDKKEDEDDFMFAAESKERSSVSKNRLKGTKLSANILDKFSESPDRNPDQERASMSRKIVKSK